KHGIVADGNGAGGHQPGAVDFDPVTDFDARVAAKAEDGGPAGAIAHHNVSPEDHPSRAADAQPGGTVEPRTEGMPGVAEAKVQGAEAHGWGALPGKGFEPLQACAHSPLKAACLPI